MTESRTQDSSIKRYQTVSSYHTKTIIPTNNNNNNSSFLPRSLVESLLVCSIRAYLLGQHLIFPLVCKLIEIQIASTISPWYHPCWHTLVVAVWGDGFGNLVVVVKCKVLHLLILQIINGFTISFIWILTNIFDLVLCEKGTKT